MNYLKTKSPTRQVKALYLFTKSETVRNGSSHGSIENLVRDVQFESHPKQKYSSHKHCFKSKIGTSRSSSPTYFRISIQYPSRKTKLHTLIPQLHKVYS